MHIIYISIVTTIVWFIAGGIVYMNPFVAKIYKELHNHPSMKHFSSQGKYLANVFLVAGLIPIIFCAIIYINIGPISFLKFGVLLSFVRIIPRLCDMWIQTSYPNKLLVIELTNGCILSFVIAYMFSVL